MDRKSTYEELERRLQEFERAESDHKKIETELRIEKDNINNIFEAMADGIYIVNKQYDIQFVNTILKKDFGIYEGKKCYEYFHDRQKVCTWCKNHDVFLGKTVRWEWHSIKNQRTYDLIDTPLTLPDGSIGKLEIFRDITEIKHIQDKLKESEEIYRSMMESMKDCAYICSPEYRIVYVNPAMESKIGYDATGEICYKTIYNSNKKCTWCTFDQIQKGKHVEYEIINPKDSRSYFVTNSPINHSGKKFFKLTILRDITERKKIERKLKKWNEELEIKITERTTSLSDVNTALRVLLKKREQDRNQISENIYTNYKSLIEPLLKQLRNRHTKNTQEDILDILESSIKEMTIPFSKKLSDPLVNLTPTEIQVALLVKEGKTNKEIIQILNKSIWAITSHRHNIRRKLGLKNKKINLRTYLLSFS
ncbi:MAG: PAS domain S-box protein [Desulfobacula sp.]|nr:PAS domain S-box protein [Desulfobacula sp.]